MSRILLTVPPLMGHFYPALELASALRRRGHNIAWALDEVKLGSHITGSSPVYPIPTPGFGSGENGIDRHGLDSLRFQFEIFMTSLAAAAFAPLDHAILDFRPNMILADHQMVAGALLAEKHNVPWLSLVTTPASIQSAPPSWTEWLHGLFLDLQKRLVPDRPSLARPDLSPHGAIIFSALALAGDPDRALKLPFTFVGPAGGGVRTEVPFPWEWLDDTRPLLVVTMGTISRDREPLFFRLVLEALEGLSVQAVLVAPSALAAEAPDNVLVREFVPQIALLERASVVLCHGGHNTVCEALARGLPLAIAPIRDDQPFIARQVVRTGAGFILRYGKVRVDGLRDAVQRLLDDRMLADAARRLAPQFQERGGDGAADVVEELLRNMAKAKKETLCG